MTKKTCDRQIRSFETTYNDAYLCFNILFFIIIGLASLSAC